MGSPPSDATTGVYASRTLVSAICPPCRPSAASTCDGAARYLHAPRDLEIRARWVAGREGVEDHYRLSLNCIGPHSDPSRTNSQTKPNHWVPDSPRPSWVLPVYEGRGELRNLHFEPLPPAPLVAPGPKQVEIVNTTSSHSRPGAGLRVEAPLSHEKFATLVSCR